MSSSEWPRSRSRATMRACAIAGAADSVSSTLCSGMTPVLAHLRRVAGVTRTSSAASLVETSRSFTLTTLPALSLGIHSRPGWRGESELLRYGCHGLHRAPPRRAAARARRHHDPRAGAGGLARAARGGRRAPGGWRPARPRRRRSLERAPRDPRLPREDRQLLPPRRRLRH